MSSQLLDKKIDVLWLVEHVARELDVACAVKAIAECKYGLKIEIRNLYQHIKEYLVEFEPKVVVHPYVYFVKGALATEDIFERWPDAVHVNAAWEQIHYKAHKKIKAPSDDIAKKGVIHFAWGDFYRDYLLEHGVPSDKIVNNGHPAYQLYKEPYRSFFSGRTELSRLFGLDHSKRWIFVPENYRWAFAQKKLDFFVSLGGDREELTDLVNFSIPSLKSLLLACLAASKHNDLEIIFRPRPAISTSRILDFFKSQIGEDTGNIKFIKEGTVREWILASDQVVSSYSTSLLEASTAGKPAWMYEPLPIPDSLHCEWYEYAPRLKTPEEFVEICGTGNFSTHCVPLADWVRKNLISGYDPIERLASELSRLSGSTTSGYRVGNLPSNLIQRKYYNQDSHEMDSFSAMEVSDLGKRWTKHLYDIETTANKNNNNEAMPIINKSMDRNDLLTPEAISLTNELNSLIREIYQHGIAPSSWVGTRPKNPIQKAKLGLKERLYSLLGNRHTGKYLVDEGEAKALDRGYVQRLHYQPLDCAEDDLRYPWFLYWEIYWVLHYMRPRLIPGMRLLDAGGASSLFTCFMASKGYEMHSVDLNESLLAHGSCIAKSMGWETMHSYCMDMRKLEFSDESFDHAFSICVFEHLDFDVKQAALSEIARCLKPGGILSLTFDYKNPAPGVVGIGKDPSPRNAIRSEADIHRSFLGTGHFELIGNPVFKDNGFSYLQHPTFDNLPYSFGAVFLKKLP